MARWLTMLLGIAVAGSAELFAEDRHSGVAERVLEAVQASRGATRVGPLVRRGELDAVARTRANEIAARPHSARLGATEPLEHDLDAAGIAYRRVSVHVDMNRGYPDPADGFVKSWSGYEPSWIKAMSDDYSQVGIGTARARDGWIILVAILLEPETVRPALDPAELEVSTVQGTNQARRERGLVPLRLNPVLVELARAHSKDMSRRGYFAHVSPGGKTVQDRVRRRGIAFDRIGENLHKNSGYPDPVAKAVEAWLTSPDHRMLLLSPDFRETGIGVAVEEDGTIFFTQLFLTPTEDEEPR